MFSAAGARAVYCKASKVVGLCSSSTYKGLPQTALPSSPRLLREAMVR